MGTETDANMEGTMRHELDVSESQLQDDWREALGIPATVWAHDERTKTIKDLTGEYDLGDQATRDRVAKAVEAGDLIEGCVQVARGHFVAAYRLAKDANEDA